MKFKLSVLALAVSLSVAACGGGGGSSTVVAPPITGPVAPPDTGTGGTPPTANPNEWTLTKLSDAGKIDTASFAPLFKGCGVFDIITSGDINNDGNDDILIGPKHCPDDVSQYTKIVAAVYDTNSKKFILDEKIQSAMPVMQWTHGAEIKDFNRDGYNDLVVVGTGPDYGQPCGELPHLLLGSPNGLQNNSGVLPQFSMYSHAITVNDFNNDGIDDFIILNNAWVPNGINDPRQSQCSYQKAPGSNQSYIVLSNGSSWTHLPLGVIGNDGVKIISDTGEFNSFSNATSADINNDGNKDLVVLFTMGGENAHKIVVLEGNGKGQFKSSASFKHMPFGENSVAAAVSAVQLDQTGKLELVINYATYPGIQASAFRDSFNEVFSYENNNWVKLTDRYFQNKISLVEKELVYCAKIFWKDLNRDGLDDMICKTISEFQTNNIADTVPRIWLKTKEGSFKAIYHNNLNVKGLLSNMVPVNIEGSIKLVGSDKNNRFIGIQIAE